MPLIVCAMMCCFFFFFNDTATTEIYTLSLHDALPIWKYRRLDPATISGGHVLAKFDNGEDRKSTRLNSSHLGISYAVFCLKKKKDDMRTDEMSVEHDIRVGGRRVHDDGHTPRQNSTYD